MESNDLELRIFISLTLFKEHYPQLSFDREKAFEDSIICSPIVSLSTPEYATSFVFNNGMEDPITTENILSEMGIGKKDPLNKLFETKKKIEWYYPYGLVINLYYDEINELREFMISIRTFVSSVQLRNVEYDKKTLNKRFSVDSYPTYLIICKDKDIYNSVCNELSMNPVDDKLYQIGNPFVVFNLASEQHDDMIAAIGLSMKIISTINGLCFKIRIKLAKALKSDTLNLHIDHSDELFEIRKLCSVAKELYSNNVVKTNIEKQIYSEMLEAFNVQDTLFQIDNAIETIEHNDESEIMHKTEKMDTTLFITGYLGLILTVFAFLPLNFGDLLWFRIPDTYYPIRWAVFIGIVVLTVFICRGICKYYRYFDIEKNHKMNSDASRESEKKVKKEKRNCEKYMIRTCLILMILILLTVFIFCVLSMLGIYQVHL